MPVTATTTLPDTTGLSFDASIEDELTASWTDVTDYGDYHVQHRVSGTTTWTDDGTVPQSDTDLIISNLKDGEKYDVRVRAETEHVQSAWLQRSEITLLPAPGAPSVTATTPSSIDVSIADNSDNEDGFRYEILAEKDNRYDTGFEASWTTDADAAPNTTTHTYGGLKENWKYKLRVEAYTEHVTATSGETIETTPIDFQDGFTLVLEDGTGDKLAFEQDEIRGVRLPNRHTVINEWEVTLPDAPGLEDWTYSEAYIWFENSQHNIAHQLVYRGEFEVPETTESRGTTIVRGKDTTRKLKRGGANVTYQGTPYWKAIQNFATNHLPDWTVTVTEPSISMLVSDKLEQSASTTADFDSISTNIASDVPVITGTDQKELSQTAYVSEGENFDSGSDSGSAGLMDRYSDGSTSSVGAATFGDSTGESVSYNVTTTHDIPEARVGLFVRRASEPATSSDLPGIKIELDGTKIGQHPAGSGMNDIQWKDYNGAINTPGWSGTLAAGSHTITISTTSTGADYWAADLVALVDTKYYDITTFDNDVGTTGYLDDPGLHPPAGESFRFDIEDVSPNIEAARIASTFTDTTGNQALAVSNDGGKTFPLSAANTSTLDQTFTDSDVGTLLTGQITLDSYGSRTTATPQTNFQTQAVTGWNLYYDGSDLPVIDDREFSGSHYKIIRTLHRESGMRFVTTPTENALQMDSFKTDDVTKTASWEKLDHTRTMPDDAYANSVTVLGAEAADGTRLKATATDAAAITADGKEIEAPWEFKPDLETKDDLESYARTRLAQYLQNDELTGTVDIVPKKILPGYSYQVPELDNQTLPLESVTFEVGGGDRGTLDFAADTDIVSALTGISTEVSTVKDAF